MIVVGVSNVGVSYRNAAFLHRCHIGERHGGHYTVETRESADAVAIQILQAMRGNFSDDVLMPVERLESHVAARFIGKQVRPGR